MFIPTNQLLVLIGLFNKLDLILELALECSRPFGEALK